MKKMNVKKLQGFTLLELLIAIGLFSILTAVAAGGYVNALRTDREVSALISAQSNAGLAMEQIAREARTGYLFCHGVTSTVPSANCNSPVPPATPAVLCTESTGPNIDPLTPDVTWTCPSLDFYNAQLEEVNYSLAGGTGTLMRKASAEDGGVAEAITADDVDIKSLKFVLQGELEGDHWNPRITIIMQVVASSTDPTLANDVLNLQTTVSSREIDCSAAAGC
ncbi:MAG TPA: prepilin-type N-terminal cleavage/methylation domain-containing protein [Candidatus Paceibacterota bacterium]|jgi:prepilin-type N-terminal cleavage/methylation domain-containing protein|nr:prepilin-type N-terminal cleavage/methylation domain-containing protein [Candidatus Paceibacterota bacterium]